jgi:hypothetical protein
MHSTHLLVVLATASLLAAGCQTIAPPNWAKSWFTEEQPKLVESKYARPVRLAVIWSPAMLNNPGSKPTRGFGGRIYFYDAQNKAIPVEGQLVVYGYNNSKPNADGKTPDRRYAFTSEQFTEHFSPTELGASYSIWIPWDEVGNHEADISLVPIFTASTGQLVVGQSSKCLLPGPQTENLATQYSHRLLSASDLVAKPLPGSAGVAKASYLAPPTPGELAEAQASNELTIRLPATLAERLASAAPAPLPQRIGAISSVAATLNPAIVPLAVPSTTANWSLQGAVPASSSQTPQPSTHFLPPRFPVPSSPGLRPFAGPPPTQQPHATQPFALPGSPPPGQ